MGTLCWVREEKKIQAMLKGTKKVKKQKKTNKITRHGEVNPSATKKRRRKIAPRNRRARGKKRRKRIKGSHIKAPEKNWKKGKGSIKEGRKNLRQQHTTEGGGY